MTRDRIMRTAGMVAAAGVVLFVVGVVIDPREAWFAYLTAVVSAMTVGLGALAMVMIAHLSGATWFVILRRAAESAAMAIPVVAVLLLPLAFGLDALYPWLTPERLEPHVRELVARKEAYLNLPFFAVRAVIYVAVWVALAFVVRRWSLRQDEGRETGSIRTASAVGAIVFAFTLTFASFDWLMSLSPGWASTIYGLRVFAGAMVSALALLAVVMGASVLPVRPAHAQALASLLVSVLLFWAYIAFSQLLVIWIANEPDEIVWYLDRSTTGWLIVGGVLFAGHFLAPFLLLLSRPITRSRAAMARIGAWLLAMHYLDVYWLVMPELGPRSPLSIWIDAAALAAVAGAACAAAVWLIGRHPIVPAGDPELPRSLEYTEA